MSASPTSTARRERPGDSAHLIAVANGKSSWRWEFYQPFVQLALDHDLPVVAANLSRGDANKVAMNGWSAVFDSASQVAFGIDRIPTAMSQAQACAIEEGHCGSMSEDEVERLACAQIARDFVLARSIRPYADRGVVLLAGNGHVRKDIGVPLWLTPTERLGVVSIGLIEDEQTVDLAELARRFDHVLRTATTERIDPCVALRERHTGRATPAAPTLPLQ